MINSDTIDNRPVLCDLTSSRKGVSEQPDLPIEVPEDKLSDEEVISRPHSADKMNTSVKAKIAVLPARSIQSLPNHLLKRIFSHLDVREKFRTELVCRKWRLIGKLLPWDSPVTLVFTRDAVESSFGLPSTALTDDILLSLLMRCGACLHVFKLSFGCNDIVPLTSKSVVSIGRYCPNLEAITLNGVPAANNDCLRMIAFTCRKLKEFRVAHFSENDSEEGVLSVVRKCEALENVTLSGLILPDKLFDVASAGLNDLTFVKCEEAKRALQNLMANSQISLRKLTLYFFSSTLMGAEEALWFAVFDHFKETLQSLSVCQIGCQVDINWCEGLKSLHNLVELTLRFYASINDDLIAVLVNDCHKLRSVKVTPSSITDSGTSTLNSLPDLKELDVSQNRFVSPRGLNDLVLRDALEVLHVGCAPRITEDFCCSLARKCHNLEILDVSGSKHMTNRLVATFREAIEGGFHPKPVKLVVGRTSVKANVKRCDGLEVDFSCPWQLPVVKKTVLKFL